MHFTTRARLSRCCEFSDTRHLTQICSRYRCLAQGNRVRRKGGHHEPELLRKPVCSSTAALDFEIQFSPRSERSPAYGWHIRAIVLGWFVLGLLIGVSSRPLSFIFLTGRRPNKSPGVCTIREYFAPPCVYYYGRYTLTPQLR